MENQKETENISDTTFPVLAGKVRIIFFFFNKFNFEAADRETRSRITFVQFAA